MQGGAGAEPDPCVFYLHLNEARGDLPFCCSHFSVCLSLPVSPADIDLFAKQGDRQCFQLFQTLCFPFHLYLGKALTPHVAAMCVAFCTWTSLVQSPVCMCVSVRVCLSWKVDVHVDAMCLRVSDPVPNQLCVYFHEQVHADSPRCTAVYLNCCTSGSLSILWCFLRSSLCCRSVTGSCFIPERVRVHLVPV